MNLRSFTASMRSLRSLRRLADRRREAAQRSQSARRRLVVEHLEQRVVLIATFNASLNTLFSTGGDIVEFHFNSPSPIVDIYCNSNPNPFVASVNANDLFFVDPTETSLLRVKDYASATGTNSYSITSSGTTGPAGRVNLESRGKSVSYQGANRIWLITGPGSSNTGLYPGNKQLSAPQFPSIQLYTNTGTNSLTIDDSGYSGGDVYTLSDKKLRSNRLGDKIEFPNAASANPLRVSLLTGSGHDTVILQGDNARISGMAAGFNQLITGGGNDTFRIVDWNHSTPHTYSFTEQLASLDGVGFALYGSTLENIELTSGQGDDHVVVGNNSNTLIGIPKIFLTSLGSGNNQVTAIDSGWSLGGTYGLTSDRFSAHLAGDVIYFQFLPTNLVFNLQSGSGNDTVNVGNSANTVQSVPLFHWQQVGAGFNTLHVNEQGYSGDVDYRLTEDRLSILDPIRNLGERIFFPISPAGSPLLQVNVSSGTGRNRFYLSPASRQLRTLPHFGVFDGGGADMMEIDDFSAPLGIRNYTFNEYGGGDTSDSNRVFYNQSVEVLNWYVNPSSTNSASMISTTNTIDALPQTTFHGPLDSITMNDSGSSQIGPSYRVYNQNISKLGTVRAQFSSAQKVNLTTTNSYDSIDLYLPPNFANSAYPEVIVTGNQSFDVLTVRVDPSDPGTMLSVTNSAVWRGNFSSRIASYGADIERIQVVGGGGNDDFRLFFPGSASNAGLAPASEPPSSILPQATNILHDYVFDGGGSNNQLLINNVAGNAAITEVVGSTDVQIGFALPDPAVTTGIFFSQIGLLNYVQPTGGNLDLSSFNPSHFQLLAGNLNLSNQVLAENQPLGSTVGTLSASFPLPSTSITYSLVSGDGDADNSRFTIVGDALQANTVFDFETQASYTLRVRANSSTGIAVEKSLSVVVSNVPEASVVRRGIFYNRSTSSVFGDGSGNPTQSIDSTKSALLPGQTTTTDHYTNYVRGLNGIFIDIANAPSFWPPAFAFATWDGANASGFAHLTIASTVTFLPGGGESGSTRVKIEFPDNAITNTWLRVTLFGSFYNDLPQDDVFYFGNAIGDMFIGNIGSPTVVRVNASDTARVRQNQSIALNSVGIDNFYDVNKDGRVNATDTSIIRQNQSNGLLQYFTAPPLTLPAEDFRSDQADTSSSHLDGVIPVLNEETRRSRSIVEPVTLAGTSCGQSEWPRSIDQPTDLVEDRSTDATASDAPQEDEAGSGDEAYASLDAAFATWDPATIDQEDA